MKEILNFIFTNILNITKFFLGVFRDKQDSRVKHLRHQDTEQNKQKRFLIEQEQLAKQRHHNYIVQHAETMPVLILDTIEKSSKDDQGFLIPIKLRNIGHPALNISLFRCYNDNYLKFSNFNDELSIFEYLSRTSLEKSHSLTFVIRVKGDDKTDANTVEFTMHYFDVLNREYVQEFSFTYYPNQDVFHCMIYSNPPKCIKDIELD